MTRLFLTLKYFTWQPWLWVDPENLPVDWPTAWDVAGIVLEDHPKWALYGEGVWR